jgi:hypothetical protein
MRPRLVTLILGAVVIAACGSDPTAGPLTDGGLTIGWTEVTPGQVADFPVVVQNTSSRPVTLLSVKLLALRDSGCPGS